ncbi:class I SAM-dependent methyltransferase [Streptomyces olivoreticuli]|uniref:O-methyltransferase n=1 Tax=Streptomyces olivoreticuli TaxID=68246 RepID=UPI0026585B50|nr:class I SAM-dependent methyltransferase [Streptomyces olivoreticuli]WKK23574.1 class I SAM-dependent methyltransferase [Streptomyces olivoreticuli]
MANQLGLPAGLSEYIRESSLREDEVLRRLRETTSELPAGSALQVMPEEGQLLTLLAGLTPARRILEIGTYTGYSTLCLARALAPGGRLVTCDITDRWPRIGAEYWSEAGVDGKIDLRIGDAVDTLGALVADEGPGTFDFVFIDADKQRYPDYYESALTLVGDHGLIVVDNTLFFGKVVDPDAQDPDTTAIRAFNTLVRDDPRVEMSLIPMADGMTLIRKKPE